MEDKKIDHLFKVKLANHEELPSADAWLKLADALEKKRRPIGLVWVKYAAGVALIVGSVYLLNTLVHSPGRENNEQLVVEKVEDVPPISVESPESTEEDLGIGHVQSQAIVAEAPKNGKAKRHVKRDNGAATSRALPDVPITEEIVTEKDDEGPVFVERRELIDENLVFDVPDPDVAEDYLEENVFEEKVAERSESEVTVRIVSRGLSQSPEKQDLVEEIGNGIEKIGGFFTKVDKGFSDLQEAKNDLFASVLTNKKERKKQ